MRPAGRTHLEVQVLYGNCEPDGSGGRAREHAECVQAGGEQQGRAAGVGAMGVDGLKPYFQIHWERIKERLLEGSYQPQAVLRVEIPKPGGKGLRNLGIPTVVDRLIQQAMHQVLNPLFDPDFSTHSYGFRPGRSAHQVLCQAREYVAGGRRWLVSQPTMGTPQGGPLSPLRGRCEHIRWFQGGRGKGCLIRLKDFLTVGCAFR